MPAQLAFGVGALPDIRWHASPCHRSSGPRDDLEDCRRRLAQGKPGLALATARRVCAEPANPVAVGTGCLDRLREAGAPLTAGIHTSPDAGVLHEGQHSYECTVWPTSRSETG